MSTILQVYNTFLNCKDLDVHFPVYFLPRHKDRFFELYGTRLLPQLAVKLTRDEKQSPQAIIEVRQEFYVYLSAFNYLNLSLRLLIAECTGETRPITRAQKATLSHLANLGYLKVAQSIRNLQREGIFWDIIAPFNINCFILTTHGLVWLAQLFVLKFIDLLRHEHLATQFIPLLEESLFPLNSTKLWNHGHERERLHLKNYADQVRPLPLHEQTNSLPSLNFWHWRSKTRRNCLLFWLQLRRKL